ncbi:MAG: hypothetical protein ACFE9L_12840 [Candidatus Hodarchaeota archaeon]
MIDRIDSKNKHFISHELVSTEGRPIWWYAGSYFKGQTASEKRLETLQRQIQQQNEEKLSYKGKKLQSLIGPLSQWFPIPLLDQAAKDVLQYALDQVYGNKNLFLCFLGALECQLRSKGMTIRWQILTEINELFQVKIEKKDYLKWYIYFKHHTKTATLDSYNIIQRIAIQELARRSLDPEVKRKSLSLLNDIIRILKTKNIIIKDYEVYGLALIRYVLDERGRIQNIPRPYRKKVTKALNRLKTVNIQ